MKYYNPVIIVSLRYKERLKWKYIQPRKQSNILRGTQWRFVRTDMDDFRTGIPHGSDKNSIVYKVRAINQIIHCLIIIFS